MSALSFLLVALQAAPGSTPDTAVFATRADYRQWPSAYDGYLATPNMVLGKGQAGSATLRCKVTDLGVLARCEVHDEAPKGYGFGKAAMKLRTRMKMAPTAKGEERWLLVPFRWSEAGPYVPPSFP